MEAIMEEHLVPVKVNKCLTSRENFGFSERILLYCIIYQERNNAVGYPRIDPGISSTDINHTVQYIYIYTRFRSS
jgi:hypothetical protein